MNICRFKPFRKSLYVASHVMSYQTVFKQGLNLDVTSFITAPQSKSTCKVNNQDQTSNLKFNYQGHIMKGIRISSSNPKFKSQVQVKVKSYFFGISHLQGTKPNQIRTGGMIIHDNRKSA